MRGSGAGQQRSARGGGFSTFGGQYVNSEPNDDQGWTVTSHEEAPSRPMPGARGRARHREPRERRGQVIEPEATSNRGRGGGRSQGRCGAAVGEDGGWGTGSRRAESSMT